VYAAQVHTGGGAGARAAGSGKDLETVTGAVRFTDGQTGHVAQATRLFLLPTDELVFAELLADRHTLPLTRLYKHLFTSTHRAIDVITPTMTGSRNMPLMQASSAALQDSATAILSHPLILMRGALSNKRIGFARGGF